MIQSNTRYNWRLDLIRNHAKIGEARIKSMTINFVEDADITRTMRATIPVDGFATNPYEIKVHKGIYFDGTLKFNGTWGFGGVDKWEYVDTEFSLFSDRIRPVVEIDGTESNYGDYVVIAAPTTYDGKEKVYDIEAYDEIMLVSQSSIPARKYYAAGTPYLTIIQALLMECGISKIYAEDNNLAITVDHEYALGTSYLTIINELLDEIGYSHVYAGSNGYVFLHTNNTKSTADFTYTDKNSTITSEIKSNTDIYSLPNVIVGYVSNPDISTVLRVAKINDNPNSLISTVRRGYNVVQAYQFDDCPDVATLTRAVDQKFLEATQATETAEIETMPDGNHEYGSYINLGVDDDNSLFREIEWQVTAGGTMSHKLERRVFV